MLNPSSFRNHRLLIAIIIVLVFLLVLKERPKNIINISLGPLQTYRQLTDVIEYQRKIIERRPSIVYECPDTKSIWHPSRASQDLTEIIMSTSDECGNTTAFDAIVLVHSSASHFSRREMFRNAYGQYNATKPFRLKVVFLIGKAVNARLQMDLEIENMQYGDTVQGSFMDTYHNLTLKAVTGFRWITETCTTAKLLIKLDDDVLFNVHRFFNSYWNNLSPSVKKRHIFCEFWHKAKVNRNGKWKVTKHHFSKDVYDFRYCSGYFVVVTPDILTEMYIKSTQIRFFWIDDVFLYGMVPDAVKNVHYVQLGLKASFITTKYNNYRTCRNTFHDNCTYFATVTGNVEQFQWGFDNMLKNKTSEKSKNETHAQVNTTSEKSKNKIDVHHNVTSEIFKNGLDLHHTIASEKSKNEIGEQHAVIPEQSKTETVNPEKSKNEIDEHHNIIPEKSKIEIDEHHNVIPEKSKQ